MDSDDVRNLLSIVSFIAFAIFGVYLVSNDSCSLPFSGDNEPSQPFSEDDQPMRPASLAETKCWDAWLIDEIIRLSEDEEEAYDIFKIFDRDFVERSRNRLDCTGNALLSISDGPDDLYTIEYHAFTDRDGDTYIGYEITDLFR